MGAAHIVIMDLDSHACPEDHSRRLARMLHGFLSPRSVDVRAVYNEQPEMLSPPPDLMLLRPAVTEDLPEVVQGLRQRSMPCIYVGIAMCRCIAARTGCDAV